MIILGISENMHDAAACVVKNGRILSAIPSERLTKVKKDASLPEKVIKHALLQAGITLEDVDIVVCATCGHDTDDYTKFKVDEPLFKSRTFTLPGDVPVRGYYIPHHICHAAAAYYTSNFDESVTFSLDCCDFNGITGRLLNSLYCHFKGNRLQKLYYPECFEGIRYAKVTEYTGFSPCLERAGTLMGLSSYGKYTQKYSDLYESLTEYSSIFGRTREVHKFPTYQDNLKETMDCAKATQTNFETNVLKYVKEIREKLGVENVNNLCLSGGSFLNCNANAKIVRSNEFENVHLYPACGDDGLVIGAALFWSHHVENLPRHKFTVPELCYTGLRVPKYADIKHKEIAQKLADGKIVGLMNGRAEFGPRALGNRSILADPRNQHVREWINHIIKKREWFRPFAPIVLEEEYQDWFDFPIPSPYMLFTAPVKQPEKIPAVTHVDGSARFQTVTEESNYDVYHIIKEFKNITGVPVLLNTSLNGKGQPILEDDKDAIDFFYKTEIDMMVVHGKVYER